MGKPYIQITQKLYFVRRFVIETSLDNLHTRLNQNNLILPKYCF